MYEMLDGSAATIKNPTPMPRYVLDKVLVTDGSHAGVEPTGHDIVQCLQDQPVDNVLTAEMHPAARRAGVRYLHQAEFGANLTHDVIYGMKDEELDSDQLAVRSFMLSLMDVPYWIGIDPHNADRAGANSLVIGSNTSWAAIGCAAILGLRNIVVAPESPYHDILQRFVKVEIATVPNDNLLLCPEYWRNCLQRMATMGPKDVRVLGREAIDDMRFFVELEICRLDDDGNPRTSLQHLKLMELLEATPDPGAYFEPIELPVRFSGQTESLGDRQLCVGYWDDNSNTPEMPEVLGYRSDGRPRRPYFGSLMVPISPPTIIEAMQNTA